MQQESFLLLMPYSEAGWFMGDPWVQPFWIFMCIVNDEETLSFVFLFDNIHEKKSRKIEFFVLKDLKKWTPKRYKDGERWYWNFILKNQ